MPMILIAGYIDFASQQQRDGVIAAAADTQQSTRDTEPGCLAYSFAADSSVPTRVQVYECWADEASLAAHFVHPNFLGMREILGRFERVGPSSVAKFRCDLSEPVYDSTRTPRADFFTAR
jgi:quinol monooxygenase YgiN